MPINIQRDKRKLKFYILPRRTVYVKVPCLIRMQALLKLGMVINLSPPAVKLNEKKLEGRETEADHLVWRLELVKADNR